LRKQQQDDFFSIRTVSWENGAVKMIDQTRLPGRLVYSEFTRWEDIAQAIKSMVVRGAPAIGVAAAMGVALAAVRSKSTERGSFLKDIETAAAGLRATRPTAVNLFWGIDRVVREARASRGDSDSVREKLVNLVRRMADEDVEANRRLGKLGAELVQDGETIMTQCNAGALATVGYGTALGIVRAAREAGKCVSIVVPETRPALQGARLTAFELVRDGFHCTVIPDTAVGYTLSSGKIDRVITGADRVTKDGFVFNKIGTYQMAVLAVRHEVPFHAAAPVSTFDMERTHDQVVIEERGFDEVVKIRGKRIVPKRVPVANPAFDMTPPDLVTSIISEVGVINAPVERNIARVIR
jgi:methylthioribose-1-phosphate isomerase